MYSDFGGLKNKILKKQLKNAKYLHLKNTNQ